MTSPVKVVGRYEIHEEIAHGGMAVVHVGRQLGDAGFTRTVAIKRLHPQYAKEPEFVSMILDEARLASRVHHPHVVSPSDVVTDEGEVYVVMDYVQGTSLARLMKLVSQGGQAPAIPLVIRIITDLLEGLHAAHEATGDDGQPLCIVHRDVSPQNVLIGRDGIARLIDFGIAQAAVRWQTTREGQIKGKLAYMAAEQLSDAEVDRRVDVYAAGVVLWEMLAGRRLFTAKSEAALFGKVLEGPIVPPSSENPTIPRALDEVVLRAVSRDRDLRYSDALAFAQALSGVVAPASRQEVVAWAQELAGDQVFSSRPSFSQVSPPLASAPGQDPTREPSREGATQTRVEPALEHPAAAQTMASEFPRARQAGLRTALVGFVALALLGAGVWWKLAAAPEEVSQDSVLKVSPSPSPPAVDLPDAEEPEPQGAPGAPAAPSRKAESLPQSPSPPSPSPSGGSQAKPSPPKPAPRVQPLPAPARPKRVAPVDCSVPYTIGADGIRRVKRECL